MDRNFISWDILLRKVNQDLIPEEEELFRKWLAEDEQHRIYFERVRKIWQADESTSSLVSDIPGVKARFDEHIRKEQMLRRKRMIRRVYQYAACCLLLFSVGIGILWFSRDKEPIAGEAVIAKTIQPGENKAIILLANGEQIDVESLDDTSRYRREGIEVEREKGTIRYVDQKHVSVEYHTIVIPKGGEYQVELNDGTKVWLNSETQLRIPTAFTGNERRVFLSGEAYFAVTKNRQQPFIVETDLGNVKVYGTEFNVKRYSDEEQLKATLVEGSIGFSSDQIAELKIKPGYQLSLSEGSGKPEVKQVKIYNEIAWKNRQFCFESKTLGEIMTTLQRWYAVKVIFTDPALKELKFSGTLNRYDKIDSLLRLFEAGVDIRFLIENDTIRVVKK